MERGIVMVGHSVIIGLLFYLFMLYILKQKPGVAEDRSILIACFAAAYMVLFGHSMPGKVNTNIL